MRERPAQPRQGVLDGRAIGRIDIHRVQDALELRGAAAAASAGSEGEVLVFFFYEVEEMVDRVECGAHGGNGAQGAAGGGSGKRDRRSANDGQLAPLYGQRPHRNALAAGRHNGRGQPRGRGNNAVEVGQAGGRAGGRLIDLDQAVVWARAGAGSVGDIIAVVEADQDALPQGVGGVSQSVDHDIGAGVGRCAAGGGRADMDFTDDGTLAVGQDPGQIILIRQAQGIARRRRKGRQARGHKRACGGVVRHRRPVGDGRFVARAAAIGESDHVYVAGPKRDRVGGGVNREFDQRYVAGRGGVGTGARRRPDRQTARVEVGIIVVVTRDDPEIAGGIEGHGTNGGPAEDGAAAGADLADVGRNAGRGVDPVKLAVLGHGEDAAGRGVAYGAGCDSDVPDGVVHLRDLQKEVLRRCRGRRGYRGRHVFVECWGLEHGLHGRGAGGVIELGQLHQRAVGQRGAAGDRGSDVDPVSCAAGTGRQRLEIDLGAGRGDASLGQLGHFDDVVADAHHLLAVGAADPAQLLQVGAPAGGAGTAPCARQVGEDQVVLVIDDAADKFGRHVARYGHGNGRSRRLLIGEDVAAVERRQQTALFQDFDDGLLKPAAGVVAWADDPTPAVRIHWMYPPECDVRSRWTRRRAHEH